MNAERIDGYATALFEVARVEGSLDEVEDELFRFARALESSDELREVLTDPAVPVERRKGVVADLLGTKASPTTTNLVSFLVASERGRELPAIIDRLVERVAATRSKVVAEVRTSIELDADQQARLGEALGRATGKDVTVKVIVDPSVMGGIIAQVGDTVIDGSVRARLDQMREAIA